MDSDSNTIKQTNADRLVFDNGMTYSQCSNVAVENIYVNYNIIENEDLIDTHCGNLETRPIQVEKRYVLNQLNQEKLLSVEIKTSTPLFVTKCGFQDLDSHSFRVNSF
ncbi:hypothetical protein CYY_007885 [Polysphondylium violaceum]|uniref:Uncharacterized protein n=1 Tax=Polysphondylium violaceum TaxID=133409 RepID=A0A8J4PP04_9MYCE|nr:hypothetical protein CYY_007885 [Polysphondylium violaceum]